MPTLKPSDPDATESAPVMTSDEADEITLSASPSVCSTTSDCARDHKISVRGFSNKGTRFQKQV